MSMLRKIQRVGKRATKFQYTATYQSVVVECTKDKWRPTKICVSWTRKGRRFITKLRPWQPSPDNKARGVVIWPEPEVMEITVTLYKGPRDQSYESKEWEFAIIDVDETGKRKVLATLPINMVRYVSSLPYEHDVHLKLKPVSRKIKSVILDVSLTSEFLKEGKATDDDMMSIASMMSISNLSTIGFLEDDEEDDYNYMGGGRSITPPEIPDHILSTDELLKWAQKITKDLPDIKIINMTTSWRNGLGFLAIIHHFRPDLMPEFDLQSPNSIKENNRMAFNLARSLGVACPLTPNMMVTTTIPDKLAVTSFVYQMYQYFTKATQSAITRAKQEEDSRGSHGASPSSPFDMKQFEMFSRDNISPVTTPLPRPDRVMQYSRHSRENILRNAEMSIDEREEEEEILRKQEVNQDRQIAGMIDQKQPIPNGMGLEQKRGLSGLQDPDTAADTHLRLEGVVSDRAQAAIDDSKMDNDISRREKDREVEFENASTDTESIRTESSTSILEEQSNLELPSEIVPNNISTSTVTSSEEISTYKYTPGSEDFSSKKPNRRRLPTAPRDTSSPKLPDKRRDQAREMLRKYKLDNFKMSPQHISVDNMDPQNKYKKQVEDLLIGALGTAPRRRRSMNQDELSSEGSATSLSNGDDLSLRSTPDSKKHSLTKQTNSDSVLSSSHRGKPRQLPLQKNISARTEETRTVNGHSKHPANTDTSTKAESSVLNKQSFASQRRYSESNIVIERTGQNMEDDLLLKNTSGNTVHIITGKQKKTDTSESRHSDSSPPNSPLNGVSNKSPPNPVSGVSNQSRNTPKPRSNKKTPKPAPVVRPIPKEPSHVLKRMEQKKLEEERAREEEEEERERERERQKLLNQGDKTDGDDVKDRGDENEEESEKKDVPTPLGPPNKKNMRSPSTWSQHSIDISQDLLQSQSEYVKTELLSLQAQVQDLEDRAQNIEGDIRGAMSLGEKESEEELMQEWFGLLNKKNELIKRQIELNMIEKEEDLEKRQFFLNRELRPLMETPEEQKTTQQKDRAAHLLRELLELIDERDRLERRKMTNLRNTDRERLGLAKAQAKSSELVESRLQGEMNSRNKDCVIS